MKVVKETEKHAEHMEPGSMHQQQSMRSAMRRGLLAGLPHLDRLQVVELGGIQDAVHLRGRGRRSGRRLRGHPLEVAHLLPDSLQARPRPHVAVKRQEL